MSLPKISSPTFKIELPISKTKLKFRPFLVKERKLLMQALESNEKDSIEEVTKQILHNCTLTDKIDIEKLPLIDIEFYFYNLRARSEGEIITQKYKCEHFINDNEKCGNILIAEFNLLELKVDKSDIKDIIPINESIGIKLKYPEYNILNLIKSEKNFTNIAFDVIANSIEYIYEGDKIYYSYESTYEELIEFLESLNSEQFGKIEEYFQNLPKIDKNINIICDKCGTEHFIKLNGLNDFFV